MPNNTTGFGHIRGLHLDFKGIQYRQEYLPQLLSDLAAQGVNTLLVEYEDIFPFRGVSVNLDSQVLWTQEVLHQFLSCAAENHLEVIPLQQCLGHLEYVFRWHRYRPYALDQKYPSTLEIFNTQARSFLFGILRQVLEAHPHSRMIHLGMDEAHALGRHAQDNGLDAVQVFLDYLDELCALCEEYGKTPVIWGDMLVDHLSPQSLPLLQSFRDRVVLCPWDYNTTGELSTQVRIHGFRVSREWLSEPLHPQCPPLSAGTAFYEDLPDETRQMMEPYRRGRFFQSCTEARLWSDLGFRVIGASAVRVSADGPVLPNYNKHFDNIRSMGSVVKEARLMGQIATSWARGTTFCQPNYPPDLAWPLLPALSVGEGKTPTPFFTGVPSATIERLMQMLGKCHEGWGMEDAVAQEMEDLEPQLTAHAFEWKSIRLMARLAALQRRADFALLEVHDFHASAHPVEAEWQRRLDDQEQLLRELAQARDEITIHLSLRYTGETFEEWLRTLFDRRVEQLQACSAVCRDKQDHARRRYQTPHGIQTDFVSSPGSLEEASLPSPLS